MDELAHETLVREPPRGRTQVLDLVLGGRADPMVVRHGESEARVDARFAGVGQDGDYEVVLEPSCVADVLGRPEFASAWRGRLAVGTDIAVGTDTAVGTDGPFRRASCCLLYRVAAPGEPAPMCGDCILR